MIDYAEDSYQHTRYKTISKSRKAHHCGECRRVIERGESYEDFWGVYDGSWYNAKTCSHCVAAREWLQKECRGWLWEMVCDDLKEHFEEMPDLHLGRLIVSVRRGWKRFDGNGLMAPIQGDPATWEAKRQPALMR
ncbi:MAG TPA: hypothetical protein VFI41_04960 [Gemmatimonadales bacterium]|nr:hypothetical protein [Gemmatimonadales bacterium]